MNEPLDLVLVGSISLSAVLVVLLAGIAGLPTLRRVLPDVLVTLGSLLRRQKQVITPTNTSSTA